ncbi:helix-turn-helix domain-containing protein [Pirellulaceae bacterium]|nr:helix-turn-helix domain-containing protein [Mariniblastus sp.]MDB4756428.1 helix-turn-helix domain-containing protein [Mariniblastus sp.]MDB4794335.1 helix-turn-helix domain-containing protein [Pirellulaceae bacterium]
MNKRKPKTLSEQLRGIIESHEKTRYRISKETGIDASQLLRFVRGTGRITNDSLDKLGECLDLEIKIKGVK